jgi:hypothetical protein
MTYTSNDGALRVSVLCYALASLAHHVHNAELLRAYPEMPAWLTRADVYVAWAVVTAVGACGYALVRASKTRAGLALLAFYAALGWYGLAHYAVAPFSAHGVAMNLTIVVEVLAATVLAVVVLRRLVAQLRVSDSPK